MIRWVPDDIDLRLLRYLQQDATMEAAKLAKLVDRSVTFVKARLKRMHQAGYILGHVTVLNRERTGLPVLVVVLVKLENHTLVAIKQFGELFRAMPEVRSCLHVAGKWDFVLEVMATTPQAFRNFLMNSICARPEISLVQSNFVLSECKCLGGPPILQLPLNRSN